MVTLSDFKTEFLKAAKWLGIIFGIIFALYLVIQVISFVANSSKRNQPTVVFGRITKIDFPKGIDNNFTYSLDTISGALPPLPSQFKVYKMVKGEPDLLAVKNASDKLSQLGFTGSPVQVSDVRYKWTSQPPLSKSITLNVFIPEFSITSNFVQDKFVLTGSFLPTSDEAIADARTFLSGLEFLPDNIDDSATKIKYLKLLNGTISEASSFSTAQLVSVYFYQKMGDTPFVYPAGNLSTINLTFGSGDRTPEIVDARFFAQKVSDSSGTYPLISVGEAYDRLKSGKGYIASYSGNDKNIFIKKAYIGYFIEGKEQNYLEPVVVFEGNNNFFAYVPAVSDEWINN